MKTFNPNIPPPNGYKFRNDDGTVLTGNGWERLERNVIAYRQRLGQSVDNVHEMIVEQICKDAPGFCHDESAKVGEIRMRESIKARAIAWLGRQAGEARGKKLNKVDRNTAISLARFSACWASPMVAPASLLSECFSHATAMAMSYRPLATA